MKAIDQYEFFGNEAQIKLQRISLRLWPFLKNHPRLSFAGRSVGVDDPKIDEVENLVGLTETLGFLAIMFIGGDVVDELRSGLEQNGLDVGTWQQLMSNSETESMCRSVLASHQLPSGYQVERISASTPREKLKNFQNLMHSNGVAPLPGFFLRGQEVPAIAEMIVTSQGEVVAAGASVFRHNPNGPISKAAHVGYLATDLNHRGKSFAKLLLARVILASFEEFGAELVHTGVKADNVPSHRVCRSCGLNRSSMYYLGASYSNKFDGVEFTR